MVTSSQLRSKLRRTDKGSAASGINIWGDDGRLLDYPAFTSTSIPANLTRGTGAVPVGLALWCVQRPGD